MGKSMDVMEVMMQMMMEREAARGATQAAFGDAWRAYAAVTPRFIAHLSKDERERPVNSR
jgi:hypothetical protein